MRDFLKRIDWQMVSRWPLSAAFDGALLCLIIHFAINGHWFFAWSLSAMLFLTIRGGLYLSALQMEWMKELSAIVSADLAERISRGKKGE